MNYKKEEMLAGEVNPDISEYEKEKELEKIRFNTRADRYYGTQHMRVDDVLFFKNKFSWIELTKSIVEFFILWFIFYLPGNEYDTGFIACVIMCLYTVSRFLGWRRDLYLRDLDYAKLASYQAYYDDKLLDIQVINDTVSENQAMAIADLKREVELFLLDEGVCINPEREFTYEDSKKQERQMMKRYVGSVQKMLRHEQWREDAKEADKRGIDITDVWRERKKKAEEAKRKSDIELS